MDVLFVLIPVSVVLVLVALRALAWAIDSGQFDELDRESRRILFEDERRTRRDTGEARDDEEARS
jgi:cbb3-type cytochrome oxidase maturation protein